MTSTEQGTDHRPSSVVDDGRLSGLADALGELARSLELEPDVDATLDAIVHAAVGTVPGAEHASISVVQRRHRLRTRAATGVLARDVDLAGRHRAGAVPRHALRARDGARPRPRRRAALAGLRGARPGARRGEHAGGPALRRRRDLGALNLHSSRHGAFDAESEHVALLFAAHAAVAMSNVQKRASLTRAVSTRQLIGQAEGILMERFWIAEDRAFAVLVKVSQDLNRKLVDIAGELVRSGEMPTA